MISFLHRLISKIPIFKWEKNISQLNTKNLIFLFQRQVKKYGENYYYLGIFGLSYYLISSLAFTFGDNLVQHLLIGLRLGALGMCFGLCIHEVYLSKRISELYMPIFWHITLLYCLPFLSMYTVFVSGMNLPWIVNLMLSEFLLYVLAGWHVCMISSLIGITLAWLLFSITGYMISPQINNYAHILVLIYGVCTISILYFLKQKDLLHEKELESRVIYGKSMAHEVKQPLSSICMAAEIFNDIFTDKQSPDQISQKEFQLLKELTNSFRRTSLKGINTINMLLSVLREDIDKANDKSIYNVHDCVLEALEDYMLTDNERQRIAINPDNSFNFVGSAYFVKHVIINLINNSFKYAGYNATIKIWYHNNKLHLKDNGIGIPPEELSTLFKKFHNSRGKLEGSGVGLSFCKEVMEKMGGWIECRSKVNHYTEFVLTFILNSE